MGIVNSIKAISKEYSKVQWPRKKEIVAATTWVVAMSIFLGIYLGVFNVVAERLLKKLVLLFS